MMNWSSNGFWNSPILKSSSCRAAEHAVRLPGLPQTECPSRPSGARLELFPALGTAVKLARALGVTCEAFADCDDVAGDATESEKPAPKKPDRKRGKK